jgi:hypothetical protein
MDWEIDIVQSEMWEIEGPFGGGCKKTCGGGTELAEAYVNAQPLESIYPPEDGLRMGTAFPNLLLPDRSNRGACTFECR